MEKSKTRSPRTGARDRILETALRLFYMDGVRATGIDKIIAESGVAKMSFYRHFPSKNDLIAEYLRSRSETWLTWFKSTVEKKLQATDSGLEVIAEPLRQWFAEPSFRGCPFINALAESPSPDPQIRQVILNHKTSLEQWIADLAARLDYAAPRQTASAIMILMDGAIIRSHMNTDISAADSCQTLLRKLPRQIRKSAPVEETQVQLILPGLGI
jgi:AcrR family transcriptional regulator